MNKYDNRGPPIAATPHVVHTHKKTRGTIFHQTGGSINTTRQYGIAGCVAISWIDINYITDVE